MSKPTTEVREEPGALTVFVDYGFGPYLVASVPTGDQAAYPAAVERNRQEAERRVAEILTRYA